MTLDEVETILDSMFGKSLPLDFILTSVIKLACRVFSHIIAVPADLSFSHGTFLAKFKTAQITPLLKKFVLDYSDSANYRPISN